MKYEEQIDRGVELLQLCQDLQSKKDGVDRPKLWSIDKSKTLDLFAMDISCAATNMMALLKLYPMMNDLASLGRKLESDGLINVTAGDSYSRIALDYVLEQHGLNTSVKSK